MRLKSFLMALVASTFSFSACAKEETVVAFAELPQQAQSVINTHFNPNDVSVITMEKDILDTEYDVRFSNGTKVEFDKSGELTKVDCGQQRVPDALLPEPVRKYIAAQFPKDFVTEWSKDDFRWKAELSNRLELIFNRKFEYVGLDD
ncbi:MAG: PepSY-like domain-containing protein [Paludibacteraceae bacterium]|nr:PepSY-like domain-containing protein [Paludibacteraceae bacterium]MBQ2190060.1 PepSY-like domain-containing protein [Paludibacteraceae bacterium]